MHFQNNANLQALMGVYHLGSLTIGTLREQSPNCFFSQTNKSRTKWKLMTTVLFEIVNPLSQLLIGKSLYLFLLNIPFVS